MSDSSVNNVRSKERKKSIRSNLKKSKEKIRKSCLSSEYKENEKEVQFLLDNSSLTIDIESSYRPNDSESQSINFFCGTSEENSSRTTGRTERNSSILDTLDKENKFKILEEVENEDENYLYNLDASSGRTNAGEEVELSVLQDSPTVKSSNFLEISIENLLTSETLVKEEFSIDKCLLFHPRKSLNFNTSLGLETTRAASLGSGTLQMLDRYHEECKSRNRKPSLEIIKAIQDVWHEKDFLKGLQLYYSFCTYQFRPIFCSPAKEIVQIPSRKLIKLYLKEIRFTQHPLVTSEHIFANKLETLYAEYALRIKECRNEKVYKALQMERSIVDSLLNQMDKLTGEDREEHALALENHSLNVKNYRNQLYDLEEQNKLLLNQLLETWLELKAKREFQQNQFTRIRLNLHVREPISEIPEELAKWNQRFKTDLYEIYREELEVFYNSKRLWKERMNISGKNFTKPKKPDLSKLTVELKTKFKKCFFSPEEPRIFITKNDMSREDFYKLSNPPSIKLKTFCMQIYFDGQFVGVTRNYRIEPDLCLYLNEVIGIFVQRSLPKIIKIKLYEKTKLPKPRKVANIQVQVVNQIDFFDGENKYVKFASQKQVQIEGVLNIRLECDDFIPPTGMMILNEPTIQDHQSETDADQKKLEQLGDLDDTVDEEGDNQIEESTDRHSLETCTFEENILQFCSREELLNNSRLRVLHSRFLKNDSRTKNLRFIPALDHELEFDWDDQADDVLDVGNWMQPIDLQKFQGKKYIKKLYDALQIQCASLNKIHENSEHLLIGDEASTWSGFFQALASMFQTPKRPLNPGRAVGGFSKTSNLSLERKQTFNIVFNIVRATGIPVRNQKVYTENESSRLKESTASSSLFMTQTSLRYSNVRPFIAMSYRDKFCRSMTADGSNPTWNENLVLQVSGSLSDFRDDIKIILFDEVVEQQWNDELNVRNMDLYQRYQTNYLGEYRIPIRTLLKSKKLDGVFELNVPKILIGYKRPSFENVNSEDSGLYLNQYPEIKESVYIWFYINMEPSFDLPSINTKCLDCSELKEVRENIHEWSMIIREQHPERFIEPLVCTMDGKRICLTRLLEPIPLPIAISENLLHSAVRYVSLINMLKHYDPCSEINGIWLDNKSILDTSWGSEKDLAVLLCNFLLTIGLSSYLALGTSNTQGECAFVLFLNDNNELFFIDPPTGKQYSIRDTFCPLQKVNYIIAKDNIFCNIQSEKRVTMTNFNLSDSSCWLSAFNKRKIAPMGGIHKLDYAYSKSSDISEIVKNIERKIIKKVNSWRPMRKTVWNRAFQPKLLSILQEMEDLATFPNNMLKDYQLNERLISEFPHYKIFGFALNFSYTNLSGVSDRVRATAIHSNSDKNVQFSLAVHIVPYPNNILSLWVFLISIIPHANK